MKSGSRKYHTAIIVNNTIMYIYLKLAIFIIFLLPSTVMFFLHCMLNILRLEKIFCEIDESIMLHSRIHQVMSYFWVFIVNPVFLLWRFFFLKKTVFPLVSLSLSYRLVNQYDTSGKPTVVFFLKITYPS